MAKQRPEIKIPKSVAKPLPVPPAQQHPYFDPHEMSRLMEVEQPNPHMPYEYKYIDVEGSKIAYLDEGDPNANPVVFLHGAPESAYIWRNVIPYLFPYARVIVPDLIGHGQSDKPAIAYDYPAFQKYTFGTLDALGLENITVVGHDWGSILALDWASDNTDKIRGAVFMECLAAPYYPILDTDKARAERPDKESVLDHYEQYRIYNKVDSVFGEMDESEKLTIEDNQWVDFSMMIHSHFEIPQRTMDYYRDPFRQLMSRYSIYHWPRMVSLDGDYPYVDEVFIRFNKWLTTKTVPTLDVYGKPGEVTQESDIRWRVENMQNHETAYVGLQLHYLQEDQPEAIGRAIADWYRRNLSGKPNVWCTPVTPEHVFYRHDNPRKWSELVAASRDRK